MEGQIVSSENSAIPRIYRTFSAKNKTTGDLIEFAVQDLTDDYAEEAADLLINHLVSEEVFIKASGIGESFEAKTTLRYFYKQVVAQKHSLACFEKESNQLVGLNVLTVKHKDDVEVEVCFWNLVKVPFETDCILDSESPDQINVGLFRFHQSAFQPF
jgi:hypothetical protein